MLALVGSGEYLPPMEAVDRELIARRGQPPRVVCLPTAAGEEGPQRIDYWSRLGVEYFTRLGAQVQALPVIDRVSANDPALAEAASKANFVYLSGGNPFYLQRTLADSRVWEAITACLERGGLLAGCSAGAMVLGERILGLPGGRPGFNFLPEAVIMPHFDEIPGLLGSAARLLSTAKLTILGIEGNTALVKDGGQYEVLGSGGVTVWNKAGKIRYTKGPLPDWGRD